MPYDYSLSLIGAAVLLPMLGLLVLAILASRRRSAPADEANPGDVVPGPSDPAGQAFELRNLKHRAADHTGPDAVVRVGSGFDAGAPIHLVVYNHGFYTDVLGAYRDAKLAEQMADASPNTVLIVPEWQKKPGGTSGDQGYFADSGLFAGMVQDAFDLVPALRGRALADVDRITILGHSAGYGPTESELYKNGIADKVVCVTLLDALYDRYGFDRWLQDNINQLSAGKKQFYNFFYGTGAYSKSQAEAVKKLLAEAGLSPTLVVEDYLHGDTVMDATTVAGHSIIFKFSSATVDGLQPHFSIPNLYVRAAVLAACGLEETGFGKTNDET